MSAVLDHHGHGEHAHDDHHHAPTGWRRWVYATNHKDIGTLYLLFAFTMLMIGGVLALLIRAELFQPGLQLVNPELFNQLTTMHGLIMVFGAIMPAFVGFANWMIPLQIGASDMAFARMNNFSFWLMIPAALMLAGSFFMPGGAPAAGWTLYAPLTLQMGPSMDAGIFAMHILGASSIMGSINIIVTILNMRAPGMTLMKMPMFAWTWLITAYLLIAVMPVLAGAITMTLTDRHFGTSFFNPAGGGDPVMYQHIFWFFGAADVTPTETRIGTAGHSTRAHTSRTARSTGALRSESAAGPARRGSSAGCSGTGPPQAPSCGPLAQRCSTARTSHPAHADLPHHRYPANRR